MQAERHGWHSLLVYSDHGQVDPWLGSTLLLQSTQKISPLVAVQPLYMHPYSVAKMVCTLSLLYERPVHLNFVSGGFPRDLETFCDKSGHDERYDRLVEYATIISKLLNDKTPCSFSGKYYQIESLQLQLASAVPKGCLPTFTTSGSSAAGLTAARATGAIAVQYLRPAFEYDCAFPIDIKHGARLGIIARDTTSEAWQVASALYPANPLGATVRKYHVSISDSVWVKELGKEIKVPEGHPYWLGPYRNGYASCPFLVGSIGEVSREIALYIGLGIRMFLIQSSWTEEDTASIGNVFAAAEDASTRKDIIAR
jgi:alkanesulfonate monooxygenase